MLMYQLPGDIWSSFCLVQFRQRLRSVYSVDFFHLNVLPLPVSAQLMTSAYYTII